VTVPKDTTAADATEQSLHMTKGVVVRVQIVFPSGCWGLVHVKFYHGNFQIWPINPDGDYAANGETVDFPESYDLKEVPAKITMWAYNNDQTYSHTITARVTVLPRWVAYPYLVMKGLVNLLGTVLGVEAEANDIR